MSIRNDFIQHCAASFSKNYEIAQQCWQQSAAGTVPIMLDCWYSSIDQRAANRLHRAIARAIGQRAA